MSRFEMCFREVYLTTLCRIRRARRLRDDFAKNDKEDDIEDVEEIWEGGFHKFNHKVPP